MLKRIWLSFPRNFLITNLFFQSAQPCVKISMIGMFIVAHFPKHTESYDRAMSYALWKHPFITGFLVM